MGTRENAAERDFSGIPLEEEEESHLKDAAVISMGTEISAEDMMNIEALCDQVLPPFGLPISGLPALSTVFIRLLPVYRGVTSCNTSILRQATALCKCTLGQS